MGELFFAIWKIICFKVLGGTSVSSSSLFGSEKKVWLWVFLVLLIIWFPLYSNTRVFFMWVSSKSVRARVGYGCINNFS